VNSKRKKKPSGHAVRMARRAKLAAMNGGAATFIKMPYVGKLATVGDWHTQVARIYRRMLAGEIPEYVGTKLVYVCTSGAGLAKIMADLREQEGLRVAFERAIELGLINRDALPAAYQTYLPASEGDDDHV
jgi:hypothetical protein